ncbi:hypothetical protein BH09BAC1_BH09BAC1_29950 [soil metagenome]
MRAIQKSILVATLLLVYGFGFTFLFAGAAEQNIGGNFVNASNYITSPFADIGFHIPQADPAVSNTIHLPSYSLKESKVIGGVRPYLEATLAHSFKHLEHFSIALLISLRKSDLLFPAHFFW